MSAQTAAAARVTGEGITLLAAQPHLKPLICPVHYRRRSDELEAAPCAHTRVLLSARYRHANIKRGHA